MVANFVEDLAYDEVLQVESVVASIYLVYKCAHSIPVLVYPGGHEEAIVIFEFDRAYDVF